MYTPVRNVFTTFLEVIWILTQRQKDHRYMQLNTVLFYDILGSQDMSRNRKNTIRKCFLYDGQANVSRCKVANCGATLKGDHAADLERHLQRQHPEEYGLFARKINSA